MKYCLLLSLLLLTITSCASLNSTILEEQNKYKVFVVNTEPTRCELVSNIQGIGTEAFEGNTRYTVPLAISNIKRQTVQLGANVLYVKNAYRSGNAYVIDGTCYKCMTKIVKRNRAETYKVTKKF